MIGAGIAQRTVLHAPKTASQAIEIDQEVPFILIDGAVFNTHDGSQTLRAQGEGTIFGAYGRTADMTAWLSTSDYVHVTVDDGDVVATTVSAPIPETPTDDSAAEDAPAADADAAAGGEAAGLSPVDSDLWLAQFQQEDVLIEALQLPEDVSMLVASDGTAPAPTELSLTWPTGATTPWAGPLMVGGGILMALGIVLYLLGLRHVRRSRGPRRKGLPLAETEPIDLSVVEADKGVISAAPTRRQISSGKRAFALVPVVAVSALLLSGCSADAWPRFDSTPTPTPSDTIIVPEGQGQPAVTETQAERILARISQQVADADEALDADAAAVRLTGPALAARQTNYSLRAKLDTEAPLDPVPATPLTTLLPQAYDGWPRTFMAVVEAEDGHATVMMAAQDDAWSDYKLVYTASLTAGASMNLAPPYVGAIAIEPSSPFLVLPPDQVSAAYADVLDKGEASEYSQYFDLESDAFLAQMASNRADRLKTFEETGKETGTLTFSAAAGAQAPVSLATLDSGAIVAVTVNDSDTVMATDEDAVIKLDDSPRVQTLTGATQSAVGFTTVFADQLFFFVPAQSSSERIQVLGYTSNILSAKVEKE
nr:MULTISPECIES: glycosyl transferase [Microbacterium]